MAPAPAVLVPGLEDHLGGSPVEAPRERQRRPRAAAPARGRRVGQRLVARRGPQLDGLADRRGVRGRDPRHRRSLQLRAVAHPQPRRRVAVRAVQERVDEVGRIQPERDLRTLVVGGQGPGEPLCAGVGRDVDREDAPGAPGQEARRLAEVGSARLDPVVGADRDVDRLFVPAEVPQQDRGRPVRVAVPAFERGEDRLAAASLRLERERGARRLRGRGGGAQEQGGERRGHDRAAGTAVPAGGCAQEHGGERRGGTAEPPVRGRQRPRRVATLGRPAEPDVRGRPLPPGRARGGGRRRETGPKPGELHRRHSSLGTGAEACSVAVCGRLTLLHRRHSSGQGGGCEAGAGPPPREVERRPGPEPAISRRCRSGPRAPRPRPRSPRP